MSAEARAGATLCLFGLCVAGSIDAADDGAAANPPDDTFLEYLGLWETSDEDWLLLDDVLVESEAERSDPVPQGEESTEAEDEG